MSNKCNNPRRNDYAQKYIEINSSLYYKVWYKLQMCPDASKWPNDICFCQLAFSLPFSNGRKTTLRTNLHTGTLKDLEVYVEGVSVSSFSADRVFELWWIDCSTS